LQEKTEVTLDELRREPYSLLLCYPRPHPEEVEKRLAELSSLHVDQIQLVGAKRIQNLNVLGKGCVGIVVKAYRGDTPIALKIRRVDADRQTMAHEAQMLQVANRIHVGPKLYTYSANFLLMEYVDGVLISEWLKDLRPEDREENAQVIRRLLTQCHALDGNGVDHGELTNASKHVMIRPGATATILDFESASTARKPANITGICQYLFLGRRQDTLEVLCRFDADDLIKALRDYKKSVTRESFASLLRVLCLVDMR